jgi:hypothetical protein
MYTVFKLQDHLSRTLWSQTKVNPPASKRLHASTCGLPTKVYDVGFLLNSIPWPVIESKEFHKAFTTLKRRLDLQRVSHSTAGEFLHTIKTLMAELKVCHLFRFKGYRSYHLPTGQ